MMTEGASADSAAPPHEAAGVFGPSWPKMRAFADLLASEGEVRGLIGPRELPRLWTRHLLNSAAVEPFVADGCSFADVGSGAGFPGIVVALMRPDLDVHLVEPMERRTVWLTDVVARLEVRNVTVHRARAEELHGVLGFDVVTARAVAALRKLVPLVGPLISPGGRLIALKGERAGVELNEARAVLKRNGLGRGTVYEVAVVGTDQTTRIVEAVKRPLKG